MVRSAAVTAGADVLLLCCLCGSYSVAPSTCDSIAELRRQIQVVGADHVIFLDEVPFKLSEAEDHTLVVPGQQPIIEVAENTTYAPRYDMIAACTHTQTFPPIIFTPADRAALGVSGITQKMFVKYIQDVLAQACGALDRYPLYQGPRPCQHPQRGEDPRSLPRQRLPRTHGGLEDAVQGSKAHVSSRQHSVSSLEAGGQKEGHGH